MSTNSKSYLQNTNQERTRYSTTNTKRRPCRAPSFCPRDKMIASVCASDVVISTLMHMSVRPIKRRVTNAAKWDTPLSSAGVDTVAKVEAVAYKGERRSSVGIDSTVRTSGHRKLCRDWMNRVKAKTTPTRTTFIH